MKEQKSMMEACVYNEDGTKFPLKIECSIEKTLDAVGGKWSFLVLRELFGGTKRFGELQRKIKKISPTALTNTLRHLEEQGVLERCVYPTVPVTVEYTLTPKGEDLHPIIKAMKLWASKWGNDRNSEMDG